MHLPPSPHNVANLDQAFSALTLSAQTAHRCNTCSQPLSSQNALDHHKITHLPKTVNCLACPRKFRRYADVLIHLEAGTCSSGTNLRSLNRLAAMCYQWKKYVAKEFRQQLLERDVAYRVWGEGPFKCPRCGEEFPLLSSLAMHVWSPTPQCGQGMNGGAMGKLKRWLGKKLFPFRAGWRTA
ncbi:hypothetical protein DOTSEDRAFT_159406 [Dothistroma septosporum NZE10]|uniref:C2H2-type domain-containing protein n=1 Tax=Dothistroma septosporum (strain NZE10 / CBS 128990) TaxID=675120 RepID=M2XIC4_DOTSN|nr:hypothetical protein DOTSEDRAFT_159406 [Dothistroma septosporum NZE10]